LLDVSDKIRPDFAAVVCRLKHFPAHPDNFSRDRFVHPGKSAAFTSENKAGDKILFPILPANLLHRFLLKNSIKYSDRIICSKIHPTTLLFMGVPGKLFNQLFMVFTLYLRLTYKYYLWG
jgi:hypothetical protein